MEMKVVKIISANSTQVGMAEAEIGWWAVVPAGFPDEVCVMATRRGHFARSDGWSGEEEVEVFPEATPEKAWEGWRENQ